MSSGMDVYTQQSERRPFKRPRLGLKPRRFGRARNKYLPVGQFRCLRWSSKDTGQNVHFWLAGNDTVPDGTGATTFSLADVNGSGELVSLFDNFRIESVQYRWVLTRDPNQATANKGWSVRVAWSHDFNDSTPVTAAILYQRANLKEVYLNNDKLVSDWYTLKPATLMQAYESAVAAAYQPKWKQWLDTGDNATPHYGIKYMWQNLYAGVNLRLEAKIMMGFKGIS